MAGTNIPVAAAGLPVAPAAVPLVAPLPIVENPEVAAARVELAKVHVRAKAAVAAANLVAAKGKEIGNEPLCPISKCRDCRLQSF